MERMKKDLEVMNTIKSGKLEYFGHIMRNEKEESPFSKGKFIPEDHQEEGENHVSKTTQLFKAFMNQVSIFRMVVNIRNE